MISEEIITTSSNTKRNTNENQLIQHDQTPTIYTKIDDKLDNISLSILRRI